MDTQERIDRFEGICRRIALAAARSGRTAGDVRLVAVSKWHDAQTVAGLAAYWAGRPAPDGLQRLPAFGESYVQEAVAKRAAVGALLPDVQVEWHFIGHVQTNKARDVAAGFHLIHSVDSQRLGAALQKARESNAAVTPLRLEQEAPGPQPVLLQVNIGREAQKSGVLPEEAEELALALSALPGLLLCGLMCLPPDVDDPEDARPFFQQLRELRDSLRQRTGLDLPHLSMGMSHDFEQAVEEGASLIRVGTDIFGPRVR